MGADHKVVSTTNQHKMFDIVAAGEDDASHLRSAEGGTGTNRFWEIY
jgi:hypothetical protein